jgi:excisionase family DNA binding protein
VGAQRVTAPLLTARDVAELLGVRSPATVLRWTRKGMLPAVKLLSGQIRYRSETLDAFLVERATPNRGALTARDDVAQTRTLSSSGLTVVPTEE